MRLSTRLCTGLNYLTPQLMRPRLRGRLSTEAYFREQYSDGPETFRIFHGLVALNGKRVLDLGCGFGGKTCYFADQGAEIAVGVDNDPALLLTARSLVANTGTRNVRFVLGDAKKLPLSTDSFDVIISTDAFEHIPRPNIEQVLTESLRILTPGGRLFLCFPPWTSPLASHLYDVLWYPWCHLLFPDEVLHEAIVHLGGAERNGTLNYWDHYKELNRVTIQEFRGFLPQLGAKVILFERTTFSRYFGKANLAKVPILGKYFTRHVVCILEKTGQAAKFEVQRRSDADSAKNRRYVVSCNE